MRELKFRAWNNGDRKMLFNVSILQEAPESEYGSLVKNKITGVVGIERSHIMQYTGPKDKKGKEIYEGDILEGGLEVVWVQICGGWKFNPSKNNTDISFMESVVNFPYDEVEIIGNIYENPELLEDDRPAF